MLSLLLSIVTYTIISSSSVQASGEAPVASMATYSKTGTGQKGQVTAGNSSILELVGYDGYQIESVTLQMHSNTGSGAGALAMTIGNRNVWTIANSSFDSEEWNGSFSSSFCPIQHTFYPRQRVGNDEVVSILVDASENSLYVQSYTIEYSKASNECFEVSFVTCDPISVPSEKETTPGAGIRLPSLENLEDWTFIGWSEHPVVDTDSISELFAPQTMYYPTTNISLYPVYQFRQEPIEWHQAEKMVTGQYVLGFSIGNMVAAGPVSNNRIKMEDCPIRPNGDTTQWSILCDEILPQWIYDIDMTSDTTLTIRHHQSGKYIGYNKTTLTEGKQPWRFVTASDQTTVFWYANSSKTYCLFFDVEYNPATDSNDPFLKADPFTIFPTSGLVPFNLADRYEEAPLYSSNPLHLDTPVITGGAGSNPATLHIGIYRIEIRDGKKYIRLL